MIEQLDAPKQLRICGFCGFIGLDKSFRKKTGHVCRKCDRTRYSLWHSSSIQERQNLTRKWRLARYNLTEDQFQAILNQQNNKCKICGIEFTWNTKEVTPHIDHDHSCCKNGQSSCGKCLRAFLCGKCNRGLGVFDDDVALLQKAMNYLKEYEYTRKFPKQSCTTVNTITGMELQSSNIT